MFSNRSEFHTTIQKQKSAIYVSTTTFLHVLQTHARSTLLLESEAVGVECFTELGHSTQILPQFLPQCQNSQQCISPRRGQKHNFILVS